VTEAARDQQAKGEMIERLAEAARSRAVVDPPRSFVPDASGGDPIPWDDEQKPRGTDEDAF